MSLKLKSAAVLLLCLFAHTCHSAVDVDESQRDDFSDVLQNYNRASASKAAISLGAKEKSSESFDDIFKTIVLNYKPTYSSSQLKPYEIVRTEKGDFQINDYSYMILEAYRKKYGSKAGDIYDFRVSKDYCPIPYGQPKCDKYASHRYRTLDGTCNNIDYPLWGAKNSYYIRHLPPVYDDGISAIRTKAYDGSLLPHPRRLSLEFFKEQPTKSIWSNLIISYGQMLAHDTTKTLNFKDEINCTCNYHQSGARHAEECLNLPMVGYDDFYKNHHHKCISFYRSAPSFVDYGCNLHPREQKNTVTAYLDMGFIYSNDPDTRAYKKGQLLYSVNARGEMTHGLREKHGCSYAGKHQSSAYKIYVTGDHDAEQNIYLTSVEVLWLRNHNYLARELHKLNPHWKDERLFQEAKMINTAMYQHITFGEYLSNTVGYHAMRKYDLIPLNYGWYNGYDKYKEAQVYTEFTAASFRNHYLVNNEQCLADRNYRSLGCTDLSYGMINSTQTCKSVDDIVRGQVGTRSYYAIPQMSWIMNNYLLKKFDSIAVFNILRARDHGIRGYIYYRDLCGYGMANSFDDLHEIPYNVRQKLRKQYKSVYDIDLWVGGASEKSLPDAMVGPTFACLIGRQFMRLKKGDRFYYENGNFEASKFTSNQLSTIRSMLLSNILCANVDIDRVVKWAFLYWDKNTNPFVDCAKWRHISLKAWKEKEYY